MARLRLIAIETCSIVVETIVAKMRLITCKAIRLVAKMRLVASKLFKLSSSY